MTHSLKGHLDLTIKLFNPRLPKTNTSTMRVVDSLIREVLVCYQTQRCQGIKTRIFVAANGLFTHLPSKIKYFLFCNFELKCYEFYII